MSKGSPRGEESPDKEGTVQSVVRALSLLELLGEDDEGYRLSDLSERSGLSPSTVHRLLTTMEQKRFVQFDPYTHLWHVGRQSFSVGAAFVRRRNFVAETIPFLRPDPRPNPGDRQSGSRRRGRGRDPHSSRKPGNCAGYQPGRRAGPDDVFRARQGDPRHLQPGGRFRDRSASRPAANSRRSPSLGLGSFMTRSTGSARKVMLWMTRNPQSGSDVSQRWSSMSTARR